MILTSLICSILALGITDTLDAALVTQLSQGEKMRVVKVGNVCDILCSCHPDTFYHKYNTIFYSNYDTEFQVILVNKVEIKGNTIISRIPMHLCLFNKISGTVYYFVNEYMEYNLSDNFSPNVLFFMVPGCEIEISNLKSDKGVRLGINKSLSTRRAETNCHYLSVFKSQDIAFVPREFFEDVDIAGDCTSFEKIIPQLKRFTTEFSCYWMGEE